MKAVYGSRFYINDNKPFMKELTEDKIRKALEEVKDPEIPVLSLIDLGVISEVKIDEEKVLVEISPTFTGCPAIDHMIKETEAVLTKNGFKNFEVKLSYNKPWNSNRITEKGRKVLKEFGLAPPPKHQMIFDIDILEHVQCPYCGSENTIMKSPFGPTLCRSLHYCDNCKQAFEQFKPL